MSNLSRSYFLLLILYLRWRLFFSKVILNLARPKRKHQTRRAQSEKTHHKSVNRRGVYYPCIFLLVFLCQWRPPRQKIRIINLTHYKALSPIGEFLKERTEGFLWFECLSFTLSFLDLIESSLGTCDAYCAGGRADGRTDGWAYFFFDWFFLI